MRRFGLPQENELVVCRITKLYPNSASAELIEYRIPGMIHVSEVASRWVRDIREFLREQQWVVCRVMRSGFGQVELSIKRVRREEATSKLNEFNRERKAEKMLEQAAKALQKTLEQAYGEIGSKLIEEFGSLSKAFETALKNPDLLKAKGIPAPWIGPMAAVAQKSFEEKTYDLKARLRLISFQPDGVEAIKRALRRAEQDGVAVRYISAPTYLLVGTGKNFKTLEAKLTKLSEEITDEVRKGRGEASFELVKA